MRCSSCEPLLDDYLEASLSRRQMRDVSAPSAVVPRLQRPLGRVARGRRPARDRAVARARRFGFYGGHRLGHGGHAAAPQPADSALAAAVGLSVRSLGTPGICSARCPGRRGRRPAARRLGRRRLRGNLRGAAGRRSGDRRRSCGGHRTSCSSIFSFSR